MPASSALAAKSSGESSGELGAGDGHERALGGRGASPASAAPRRPRRRPSAAAPAARRVTMSQYESTPSRRRSEWTPACVARATTVLGLSPEMILTSIPASENSSSVPRTPGRSSSLKQMRASASRPSGRTGGASGSSLKAAASSRPANMTTRRPRAAHSSARPRQSAPARQRRREDLGRAEHVGAARLAVGEGEAAPLALGREERLVRGRQALRGERGAERLDRPVGVGRAGGEGAEQARCARVVGAQPRQLLERHHA